MLAGRIVPWALIVAALATLAGLCVGFFVAPTDRQQGEEPSCHVALLFRTALVAVCERCNASIAAALQEAT